MSKVTDYSLQFIDLGNVSAIDLSQIIENERGYDAYRVYPIGEDGYRQSVSAQMIYNAEAGRAGIAWGGNSMWTDCSSPEDAAERFFEINDKEMCN